MLNCALGRRCATVRRLGSLIALGASALILLLAASGAHAATTLTVTSTADDATGNASACTNGQCPTLRDAVAQADSDSGDTIILPALSGQPYTLSNGELDPLVSSSVGSLTLSGGQIGDSTSEAASIADAGSFDWTGGSFIAPAGELYPPAAGVARQGLVALFAGCIMSTAYAETDRATARLLARSGAEVTAVAGPLGIGGTAVSIWDIAKWPVIVLVVITAVAVLYWAAPNVRHPGFRWITPGGLLAVLVWILASGAFALYVAGFSSYNKTSGSLAGVIIFLIWLWISNLAVLLGAEFNAELERRRELESGVPLQETLAVEPRSEPSRPERGEPGRA